MKDYTVAVNELRNHYNELRLYKKSVRTQVKMEFEAKIDFEIKSRLESAELKFANHLAAVKDRDELPVSIIQNEVLRTRTWSVWERIRDLAGVAPEFVRAEDVRAVKRDEKARAAMLFEWIDGVLHVYRNVVTKAELPHVVKYPLYNAKGVYIPSDVNQMTYLTELVGDRSQGFKTEEAATEEVKRAFETGELTKSTHPYDYVNQLDNADRAEYLSSQEAKFHAANPWLGNYAKESN